MDYLTQHKRDVASISEQVKKFHQEKKHFRIYHGSTGSTRPMAFTPGSYVNTSGLNRIFPIDKTKHTVKVEPKVPMDVLVQAMMAEGFLPEVVPELMGITVGGAFSGTAGESSSYRYGLFEETVTEIEIVLGDGSITTASNDFQPDLYEWAGSSMGTLGIVTLLEVKLIPAKKYVHLDIKRVKGITDAMEQMEVAIQDPSIEYIDGMLFNKDFGVVMMGHLVDEPKGAEIHSFHRRNEPWFTNYIEKVGNDTKRDLKSIAVPVTDYFFRYDRGVFWGGKLGFDYFHVPFNRLTRWLLDPLMNSRVAYHGLHEGGFANRYVVQDFDMPCTTAAAFVDYISNILPYNYQFWLCPAKNGTDLKVMNKFRAPSNDPAKRRVMADERIYNVGVYGKGPSNPNEFVRLNREIEHKLWHDFCGVKVLYAHAYYTEEEFWDIYNREPYDEVRRKYHAEGLPTVFDKINADMKSGRKPPRLFAGYYGAIKGFLGVLSKERAGSYLIAKNKKATTGEAVARQNGVNGGPKS